MKANIFVKLMLALAVVVFAGQYAAAEGEKHKCGEIIATADAVSENVYEAYLACELGEGDLFASAENASDLKRQSLAALGAIVPTNTATGGISGGTGGGVVGGGAGAGINCNATGANCNQTTRNPVPTQLVP